jgi:hypothetical protein
MCIIKKTKLTSSKIKQMTVFEYMIHSGLSRDECISRIRNFNRSWNKHLSKLACMVCRYSSHVELAHIKAIKDFDLMSKIGEINDESNILTLCPTHHWEFDQGNLSLDDILQNC